MKKVFKLIIFVAFIAIVQSSCQDESTNPETLIGTWTCTEAESPNSVPNPYFVYIEKSEIDSSVYLIGNYSNLGAATAVKAKLNGNTFTILSQQFTDGSAMFTTQGEGTVSNNTRRIDLSYLLDGDEVNAVLTKK